MRNAFLLFILLFSTQVYAQAVKPDTLQVNPDRPDESDDPYIIQTGYLQIENGFFFEKEKGDIATVKTYGLQDVALRLGIARKIEFQLLYLVARQQDEGAKTKTTGIALNTLGLKYNVATQKGTWPTFSIAGGIHLPFLTSKAFRNPYTQYSAALLFQHEFNKSEIGYNIGFSAERNLPAQWIYAISYTRELTEQLSGYIENYSSLQQNQAAINLNTGLTYSLSNLFVLDIATGITLNQNAHFFTVGFSYLIPKKFF